MGTSTIVDTIWDSGWQTRAVTKLSEAEFSHIFLMCLAFAVTAIFVSSKE